MTVRDTVRNETVKFEIEEREMSCVQLEIFTQIIELMESNDLPNPPNLRRIDRRRLKEAVIKVNDVISAVKTDDITQTNRLIKPVGAIVTAKIPGVKQETTQNIRKEPFWKRRIERKIDQLRKDVSLIERWKEGIL